MPTSAWHTCCLLNFIFTFLLAFVVQVYTINTKMVDELIRATHNRVEQVYLQLESNYGRKFNRPTILFDVRGRKAGCADYTRNLIRFNKNLLLEYKNDFIQDTPGHEVCHLVARQVYGLFISSHGSEWKSVMRVIGQSASRCHNFIVKTNHIYTCKCQQKHYLSTRFHNQVIRGASIAKCKTCNQNLIWENFN